MYDVFGREMALMSSTDTAADQQSDAHDASYAAKGLEFPVVFMAGLKRILPHAKSV